MTASVSTVLSLFSSAQGAADVVTERMIGRLVFGPLAPVDGTISDVDFGIVLVTSAAFAAGVAAVPKVNTEPDAEWLWVSSFKIDVQPTITQSVEAVYDFDVKARRVFEGERDLVLVMTNNTGAAARVQGHVRLLSRIRGT